MIVDGITLVLLATGVFFILVAGIGTLRMPDVFTRMHAITKAGSLGVGLCMAAVAVHFHGHIEIVTRAVAVIVFTLLTSPASAQMIGRAAYLIGVPMADSAGRDELRDNDPAGLFASVTADPPPTVEVERPQP